MLTPKQESYILNHAYVPEHIVGLMTGLSGGEPFLLDHYFFCYKDNWIVLVGYPLQAEFTLSNFEAVIRKIKEKFKPERISLIAPELSERLASDCRQRDSDAYFVLDACPPVIGSAVRRNLKKATRLLTVERAAHMEDVHDALMREFVHRVGPPSRVRDLFFKMPRYVASAPHACVLNAWRPDKTLAAFYVVDHGAKDFANYIIGCYSKSRYVIGASDLLLSELIKMSMESGKDYIHLGLGVNSGIRRFKEKWGARRAHSYEMCELVFKKPLLIEFIRSIMYNLNLE
jgi:hypothetical protein